MKPMRVGEPLPMPYIDWVRDPGVARVIRRVCETCGSKWTNGEVPMYAKWDGNRADLCPEHNHFAGNWDYAEVLEVTPIRRIVKRGHVSQSYLLTVTLGGVYRRRKCPAPNCNRRWTTIELPTEGYIVEDVTKCRRCGGVGRTQRHMTGRQRRAGNE